MEKPKRVLNANLVDIYNADEMDTYLAEQEKKIEVLREALRTCKELTEMARSNFDLKNKYGKTVSRKYIEQCEFKIGIALKQTGDE